MAGSKVRDDERSIDRIRILARLAAYALPDVIHTRTHPGNVAEHRPTEDFLALT